MSNKVLESLVDDSDESEVRVFQCPIEDMEMVRSMVSRLNTILVFHNSIAMETIIVRMNM